MRFREGKLKEARAKVAVTEKALEEKAAALAIQDKEIAEMQAEYRRDRQEQELLERERDDTEEAEGLIHVMTSNLREMQGKWTQQLSAVRARVHGPPSLESHSPRPPPCSAYPHRAPCSATCLHFQQALVQPSCWHRLPPPSHAHLPNFFSFVFQR